MSEYQEQPQAQTVPPTKALDAIYLEETIERCRQALRLAKHEIAYLKRDITSLQSENLLHDDYQSAYRDIVDLLNLIEKTILEGEDIQHNIHSNVIDNGLLSLNEEELNLIPSIKTELPEVILQINNLERELISIVQSAKHALEAHAKAGLIDWSMPFECEFSILFENSPSRMFYNSCGDGDEPLRIEIRPSILNFADPECARRGDYDWNMFSHIEDHPLKNIYQGYLVHSIIEHTNIPWQMLSFIREIEVTLKFYDFETAWSNRIHLKEG